MGKGTRPAARATNPTFIRQRKKGRGFVSAKKITVAAGPTITDFVIPNRAEWGVFKNSGANPIRMNFNSDVAPQFYLLVVNEVTPAIQVSNGTTMHLKGQGGASELQCLLWG